MTTTNAIFERAYRALGFLERHQLDPSPVNYHLAFNYVTHPQSPLAHAVNDLIDGGLRLLQEDATSLAERFLTEDARAIVIRREQQVARQTDELGTLTQDAHQLTSTLEQDVGAIVSTAQAWPEDAHAFVDRLSSAERELAILRGEVARLQQSIQQPENRQGESDRDSLTRAFNQEGAAQLLGQFATTGRSYLVAMFSLDDLSSINERYGRMVGDNVLRALAATLEQVFAEEQLFRWSGNEFILVLNDMTLGNVRMLSQEALAGFESRRLRLRGSGEWIGVVTASAAIVPGHHEAPNTVLARARDKLVAAIAEGGNRIVE